MLQDKAQFAVNGCSLNKNCNAVLSYLWVSLRARREAVSCKACLAGNGGSFPRDATQQLTASRRAESTIKYTALGACRI